MSEAVCTKEELRTMQAWPLEQKIQVTQEIGRAHV